MCVLGEVVENFHAEPTAQNCDSSIARGLGGSRPKIKCGEEEGFGLHSQETGRSETSHSILDFFVVSEKHSNFSWLACRWECMAIPRSMDCRSCRDLLVPPDSLGRDEHATRQFKIESTVLGESIGVRQVLRDIE